MYLSRLILNPRSKQVQKDVSEPYEMHRSLMRAFPTLNKNQNGGILWRLVTPRPPSSPHFLLYVQSKHKPDWSKLSAVHQDYFLNPADADVDENPACKEISETEKLRFPKGHILRFCLRANPTKKVGSSLKTEKLAGHKKNGKRIALIKEQEQIDWLQRKGAEGGFRVLSAIAIREDDLKHLSKGNKQQTGKLSLLSVDFHGTLQVIDPERFLQTILSGIGPGKAFGFGLLILSPA